MPRRVVTGVVTGDKAAKTRRVEVPRLVKHPKYGKYLRRRTVCYVHDENNDSKLGDTVEITEAPPRSRLKRWELVRSFQKGLTIESQFTRGSWKNQASDAEGNPFPNNILKVEKDTTISIAITDWKGDQTTKVKGGITGTVRYHREMKGDSILARDVIVWLTPGYKENP